MYHIGAVNCLLKSCGTETLNVNSSVNRNDDFLQKPTGVHCQDRLKEDVNKALSTS